MCDLLYYAAVAIGALTVALFWLFVGWLVFCILLRGQILSTGQGLQHVENYHELCRLLSRLAARAFFCLVSLTWKVFVRPD